MSADNWTTCPKCKLENSLREDYEQGMTEDGLYFLSYSARCSGNMCKFEFHKDIEEQAYKDDGLSQDQVNSMMIDDRGI